MNKLSQREVFSHNSVNLNYRLNKRQSANGAYA
jgi:hypothetical protein